MTRISGRGSMPNQTFSGGSWVPTHHRFQVHEAGPEALPQGRSPGGSVIAEFYRTARGRSSMPLTIEVEQEEDGRWLAEVPELPGVLTYGQHARKPSSVRKRSPCGFLADRLDHG